MHAPRGRLQLYFSYAHLRLEAKKYRLQRQLKTLAVHLQEDYALDLYLYFTLRVLRAARPPARGPGAAPLYTVG